jgi:hypothetical protein
MSKKALVTKKYFTMKIKDQKSFLEAFINAPDESKLKQFLANGGQLHHRLGLGVSALYRATDLKQYKAVELLLKYGMDVNIIDTYGRTAISCPWTTLEIAQLLIDNGANLEHRDKKKKAVNYFHIAFEKHDILRLINTHRGHVWSTDELRLAKVMEEDQFWEIIRKSHPKKGDETLQSSQILRDFQFQDPPTIFAFERQRLLLSNQIHLPKLWAAAHLLEGKCTQDSFEVFKDWVICLGESAYKKALKNPDNLLTYFKKKVRYPVASTTTNHIESLSEVAPNAYRLRTGLQDYTQVYDDGHSKDTSPSFSWQEGKQHMNKANLPKIWKHTHP